MSLALYSPLFFRTISNSSNESFFISFTNICSSCCKSKLTDSLNFTPLLLCLVIISGSTLNPFSLMYCIISSKPEFCPNISLKTFESCIAFFLALLK